MWLGDELAKASPHAGITQAAGWGSEERNNSTHSDKIRLNFITNFSHTIVIFLYKLT